MAEEQLLPSWTWRPGEMPETWPPILRAAREGDVEAVRRLVAEQGRPDAVFLADSYAAGSDLPARNGDSALHLAARNAQLAVVDELLRLGMDVNTRSPETQSTALMVACQEGHAAVVRRLLAAPGVLVNAHSSTSPGLVCGSHLAAERGYTAILCMLFAAGGDPTAQRTDKTSVLSLAAWFRWPQSVNAILRHVSRQAAAAAAASTEALHEASQMALVAALTSESGWGNAVRMALKSGEQNEEAAAQTLLALYRCGAVPAGSISPRGSGRSHEPAVAVQLWNCGLAEAEVVRPGDVATAVLVRSHSLRSTCLRYINRNRLHFPPQAHLAGLLTLDLLPLLVWRGPPAYGLDDDE